MGGGKYRLFAEDFCYYVIVLCKYYRLPWSVLTGVVCKLCAVRFQSGGIELLIVVYVLDGDSGGYLAVYRDAEDIFDILIINCTNNFIYFVQMVETKKFGHNVLTN